MIIDNPIIIPVLEILKKADAALSEHQLMKQLEQNDAHFGELAETQNLALFQKHFLIMNALYQLQQRLFDENLFLHISALAIYIRNNGNGAVRSLPEASSDEQLRNYYTDWQNFLQATERQVNDLLGQFWKLYSRHEKTAEAYQQLDLPQKAGWPEIQQNYRKLAAIHHPDRGGDSVKFIAIRQAYETLRPLEAQP